MADVRSTSINCGLYPNLVALPVPFHVNIRGVVKKTYVKQGSEKLPSGKAIVPLPLHCLLSQDFIIIVNIPLPKQISIGSPPPFSLSS
jgi:hypothetical protein